MANLAIKEGVKENTVRYDDSVQKLYEATSWALFFIVVDKTRESRTCGKFRKLEWPVCCKEGPSQKTSISLYDTVLG